MLGIHSLLCNPLFLSTLAPSQGLNALMLAQPPLNLTFSNLLFLVKVHQSNVLFPEGPVSVRTTLQSDGFLPTRDNDLILCLFSSPFL